DPMQPALTHSLPTSGASTPPRGLPRRTPPSRGRMRAPHLVRLNARVPMVDEDSGDPSLGVELIDLDLEPAHVAPKIDGHRVHAGENIEEIEFQSQARPPAPSQSRRAALACLA